LKADQYRGVYRCSFDFETLFSRLGFSLGKKLLPAGATAPTQLEYQPIYLENIE
tara:strand:- start:560 stop:721 length:162 start_codon:yes stop_codon:yes gene_type:complete